MLKYLVVSAIKIVFLPIILLTLFPITGFAYVNFSDVNDDSHYKDAIDWMSENGFINGHPDGTFRPDDCVNRVELLKMIFETLEINIFDYNADLFSDTEANVWYTPYVIAGRARGTIVGYPDGTFKPDQCANRVEAIKMAILEFNNGEIPEQWDEFENPFDIAQVKDNPWWMPYFKSAMGANLIGIEHFERFDADWMGLGVDSDSANPTYNFGPSESMTRKEVAEMLYRMRTIQDNDMQYFDENIEPDNVDTMPEEEEANNSGEPPSENEEEPATEEEPPSENEEEPATEEEPPSENEEEPTAEEVQNCSDEWFLAGWSYGSSLELFDSYQNPDPVNGENWVWLSTDYWATGGYANYTFQFSSSLIECVEYLKITVTGYDDGQFGSHAKISLLNMTTFSYEFLPTTIGESMDNYVNTTSQINDYITCSGDYCESYLSIKAEDVDSAHIYTVKAEIYLSE